MLSDILVQLVFGFPAGVISMLLSAFAIWKKWMLGLIVAGLLTVPFTLYLTFYAFFERSKFLINKKTNHAKVTFSNASFENTTFARVLL